MRMFARVAPLLFPLLALTQGLPGPSAPARVNGTVVNTASGGPLADVLVTLTPEARGSPRSAVSDESGRFSIEGLAPGRYAITATRTLYFRQRKGGGTATVSLAAGEVQSVQLRLAPTAVISGRVFDESGTPERGVQVQALVSAYRDGTRTLVQVEQQLSDDRGAYRIFNLPSGSYYVRAVRQGQRTAAPVYFPSGTDPQSAVQVQLGAASEQGGVDIRRTADNTYLVRFRVAGIPDDAGYNTVFTIVRRSADLSLATNVLPEALGDKTYRLSLLPAGSYDIFAQARAPIRQSDPSPLPLSAVLRVELGGTNDREIDAGILVLRSHVSVPGLFQFADTPPGLSSSNLVVTLRSLGSAPARIPYAPGNASREDRAFTIQVMQGTQYAIAVGNLPPQTYLTSARLGGREILDSGLIIYGESPGVLELTIAGSGALGSLTGVVRNAKDEPVPDSTVVLIPPLPRRMNPDAFRVATTDHQGLFSVQGVIPGEYAAVAWEDIEPGAYYEPSYLRQFEGRSTKIEVRRGIQSTVALREIPATN